MHTLLDRVRTGQLRGPAYGFAHCGVKFAPVPADVPQPIRASCSCRNRAATPTERSVSNFLARLRALAIFRLPFGAVAQLGERRTGSAEVWGSIPHSSTEENALS